MTAYQLIVSPVVDNQNRSIYYLKDLIKVNLYHYYTALFRGVIPILRPSIYEVDKTQIILSLIMANTRILIPTSLQ